MGQTSIQEQKKHHQQPYIIKKLLQTFSSRIIEQPYRIDHELGNNRPGRDSEDITAGSSRSNQDEIWRTSRHWGSSSRSDQDEIWRILQQDRRTAAREDHSDTIVNWRRMEPEGETCPSEDHILDCAIEYKLSGTYPPSLTKDKKRAVRKRAATLITDNGEIYVQRKKRRVKVVTSVKEQGRILIQIQSDRFYTDCEHFI